MSLRDDVTTPLPSFIIRDLDKDPHGPALPPKYLSHSTDTRQLHSPATTASSSPKTLFEERACSSSSMTRSGSDLSSYTNDKEDSHSRSPSMVSQRSTTNFPFTSIFKWKRTISTSSLPNSTGLQSPPVEEGSSRSSSYFVGDSKSVTRSNLDNLGLSLQTQRSDFNSTVEAQLQEERRLRHLAEDRLTEVEEEITRLCTITLPTDTGETGEAYFSSIIHSVRLAIDSYEERTDGLEKQLEDKTTRLALERRERTSADIECTSMRTQMRLLQAQLGEAQQASTLEQRNEELVRQNRALQDELDKLKSPAEVVPEDEVEQQSPASPSEDDRPTLLQRVKDTEAQRDALRQVSRGLRQRLTIETRKNADKMRALAAIDYSASARQARSHSRQNSSCLLPLESAKRPAREASMTRVCESLGIGSRPRPERFVTALETPTLQSMAVV